jgi:RHS repeat-associated protein
VNYSFDAFGNRLQRQATSGSTTTTERFAYDGWDTAKPGAIGSENFDVYADLNSSNSVTNRRLFGPSFDEPLARQDSSGVVAWYGTDQLGSVRTVFDNSGTVTGTRSYSGFGEITSETGTGLDRYAYTAREWDGAAGLQYSRARMYDPKIGRWTSEDPIGFAGGDSNLSRYVGNGATLGRDPSGLICADDEDGRRVPDGVISVARTAREGFYNVTMRDGRVVPMRLSGDLLKAYLAMAAKNAPSHGVPPIITEGQAHQGKIPVAPGLKPHMQQPRAENPKQLQPLANEELLDGLQFIFTVGGFVPVIGEPLDMLDGIVSFFRGDYAGAALSMASIIPFLGMPAGFAKLLKKMRLNELKSWEKEVTQHIANMEKRADPKELAELERNKDRLKDIQNEIKNKEDLKAARRSARPDCSITAELIKKKIGGEIHWLKPKDRRLGTGVLPGQNKVKGLETEGGWQYHAFVIQDGKYYDEFYPDGIPYDEWLKEYNRLNGGKQTDNVVIDTIPHPQAGSGK